MSTLPLIPTIGIPELLIVLVIVLIFFGVGKLPQIGKALGEGIKGFKDGTKDGTKDGGESARGQIDVDLDHDEDQALKTKARAEREGRAD